MIECVSLEYVMEMNTSLLVDCLQQEKVSTHPDLSLDWEEEMSTGRPHDCVSLPTSHPLYVLYTSGTTGTPNVQHSD